MKPLSGSQKKYLRGLAHDARPLVLIGQKGVTDAVVGSLQDALDTHELVKIKFIETKEKDQKKAMVAAIEAQTGAQLAGMIGHTAIFYRRQQDPEKRRIVLPGGEPTTA